MDIFNIFRKKSDPTAKPVAPAAPATPAQPVSAPATSSAPSAKPAAAPVQPLPQQSAAPAAQVASVAPVTPPVQPVNQTAQPAAQPRPQGSMKQIAWPSFGDSAAELSRGALKVYLDRSVVGSAGLRALVKGWHEQVNPPQRFLFIPQFEFDAVTDAASKAALASDPLVRTLNYTGVTNFIGFFGKIRTTGPAIYLLHEEERMDGILEAAKSAGEMVRFYRLSDDGRLAKLARFSQPRPAAPAAPARPAQPAPGFPRFALSSEMVRISRAPAMRGSHPAMGAQVKASDGSVVRLGREVSSISQSITYETNLPGLHAKIYTRQHLTLDVFEKKCRRMLEVPVQHPAICWPRQLLTNECGEFVGVLIPAARGLRLKDDVLTQAGLEEHFPHWDKRSLVTLTRTVLDAVICLHDRNILFGNVDMNSILVVDEKTVYFTNTEGYQIEGFPCDRQNTPFQPPEYQLEERRLRLYTPQEERFGLATLVFMLLMNGREPYVQGKNRSLAESIAKMEFPFYAGKERGVSIPIGRWRFVWSHLHPDLKSAFFNTFMAEKAFSKPAGRKDARYWMGLVRKMEQELESPFDKGSLNLFPPTYKRNHDTVTRRCSYCGVDHPDFFFAKGRGGMYIPYNLCIMCSTRQSDDPSESFTCEGGCGRTFYYTNETALYHRLEGHKRQKYCRDCKQRMEEEKNVIVKTARCADCGCMFSMTQGEVDYFVSRGMNLPNRCPECRKRKKAAGGYNPRRY